MFNPLVKLLSKILRSYDIPITHHTIEQTILTHPEYPSMQCVSDALDRWRVKHIVMKITLDKLKELDVPVIAHLKKGEFVWVAEVTDSTVYFEDASGKSKTDCLEHFEQEWSGVALAIEDITDAGDPDYQKEHSKELKENIFKYAFVGACMVLLSILGYFSWTSDSGLPLMPKLILLLTNVAGCYIAYTLIRQERFQLNRFAQKFCKTGKHIDCLQVTKSKYSKLLGVLSWAELGAAYFSTVTLWTIIAPISSNWVSVLWWLLLLPLPFTLWSLYTQAFLIRKWCLFCCTIVLLLGINATVLYFVLPFGYVFPIMELSLVAFLFLTCVVVVMYINKTNKVNDPYVEQREIARIKYDSRILQSQLSEEVYKTDCVGFVWGNPRSSHEIVLYASTSCSHCGKAVKELRRLMDIYPDFKYRLIFGVHTDDSNDDLTKISHYFTSHYKSMNQKEFLDMLDSWYALTEKTLEALQKVYPVSSAPCDCKEEMAQLYQFSQQTKVSYVPALFLDGRLLSSLYSYMDLYGIARALNAE